MKKMRSIALLFCVFMAYGHLNAQAVSKTSAPTDATSGYTYDYELAKKMIIDHQVKPNGDNQIADPIVKAKDFPKLKADNELNNAYYEKLRVWMEANSALIIETFKSRKDIVHPFGN